MTSEPISKQISRSEGLYRVVGATHDDNKEVIWVCKYYEPFNVVSAEDSKTRRKQWIDAEKYFGKMLRVQYDRLSKRGIPEGNVVGIGFEEK